jgi:hypothetical protein
MATKNDITGDLIASKTNSDAYRDGWERIFSAKKEIREQEENSQSQTLVNTEKNQKNEIKPH